MDNARLYTGFALIIGGGFFILAVTTTFTLTQILRNRFDPFLLILVNFIAGIVEVAIGYQSMITLGGRYSLGIAQFSARMSGSKQVLEVVNDPPRALKHQLIHHAYLAYLPVIVFLVSVAISWDIHTLDTTRSGIAQPFFRALDLFVRNARVNPVLFSLQLVPTMLLVTFLAGTIPSIALPYFGRFRVTGVNSAPFHKGFLFTTVAVVGGASAVFTLSGLFYKVLLTSQEPVYYHYALLDIVGLSLYYAVGSYHGLGKAQKMIAEALGMSKPGDFVSTGKVTVS